MSDRDFAEILPALITATLLLCCCCLVVIGGGAGAFFYFRNRRQRGPAATATVDAKPTASAPATFVPTMAGSAPQASEAPSVPPSPFAAAAPAPEPPAMMASPAGPIEPDDIRAKLLALNSGDKPYVVQASGYKIAIAPTAVTGYLLEISFDYVEKVARFVETNPLAADQSIRFDARQTLEAEGWTVRE